MNWWWLLVTPVGFIPPLMIFYGVILIRSGRATKGQPTYCGPGGWGDRFVPDVIVLLRRKVSLMKPCRRHDGGYEDPQGHPKWWWDYQFLGDHLAAIHRLSEGACWPGYARWSHQLAALIVFGAVLLLGRGAWKRAREKERERSREA